MLKAFRVNFMGGKLGKIKSLQSLAQMHLLSLIKYCKDSKGQLWNYCTFRPLRFLDSKEIHKSKLYGYTKDIRDFNT